MYRHARSRQIHDPDYVLVAAFGVLLIFGLVMLISASAPVGYAKFGDSYFFIKRQFIYGMIPGLILCLFLARCHYQKLARWGYAFFAVCLLLLIAVLIPGVGSKLGTASRSWIVLGSLSFQPAEMAKFLFILFFASYLAKKGEILRSFEQGFLPTLAVALAPVVLVLLQPDVGTATIMFAILFGMLFAAGARVSHLLGLASIGILGFVVMVAVAPYRVARLTTFLHPELDPQGIGYQINQAFMAIGSGGVFGLGLGHSQQKFQYLPEVHSDSIFAVIGEEMGLVVASGFIVLLVFVAIRSLRLASRISDTPARLVVTGIIVWFMTQSFFNIGAMVGLLPLTGVPLPFVSHGGTALMMSLAAVGVIVNVSKQTTI